MHLKSTNKINKDHHTLKEKKPDEVRNIINKELKEEDIEIIRKAFTAKGVRVSEKMIDDLLKNNETKAVEAAIKCTDFTQARNPLAVIKWMLANDTYVMPAEQEELGDLKPEFEKRIATPEEDEEIRGMIKTTKELLTKKTMQSV